MAKRGKAGVELTEGNDESEIPQAISTQACWPVRCGQPYHQFLSDIRRVVGVLAPLLPQRVNTHPLGGGRPHVPDRTCANGICYVLRTGCQWKALDATGICSGPTAHLRFQEWVAAGVFLELWRVGLERYDELKGLDWSWLSLDGAIPSPPWAGGKPVPTPRIGVSKASNAAC